ncbi:hypothetical protein SYNTR_0210 [Candidatus Syntrophocurvum alkaliphilum]|uniref:Uncharacterized protein n=1 Tax=Candidatus Syntrophocurvum alkaliphilum TaxID=2293317 RepID=A0A6I6D6C0_9FIRM|nr:hypothetical protein [Candidatus Syntrophocurvum alkaliphilum]QGT98803.1 hypothetical protein SYNTR_0210 [Candidatus Syntrophocurvum alkaliphilum]
MFIAKKVEGIKDKVFKSNSRSKANSIVVNVPYHRRKDEDSVDNLIKQLAGDIVSRLDSLEEEADLDRYIDIPDTELQNEALKLKYEINKLKSYLNNL